MMHFNTTRYDPSIGIKYIFKTNINDSDIFYLDPFNPFGYVPDLNLAIASTVVYGVVTILLTISSVYYRTWYFLVMTISGVSEVIGYAYRWTLAHNPDQRTPYVYLC